MYSAEDYLQLSGIQHFAFCKRQWALIHLDLQWNENELTTSGRIIHNNVDNGPSKSSTKESIILRSVPITSSKLGLNGIADVIEVTNTNGKNDYTPIEYKHGIPKSCICDKVQVCAQALCIEEMTGTHVNTGAIYYYGTRRREYFPINIELRESTIHLAEEMHNMFISKQIPAAEFKQHCISCSLYDCCLPFPKSNHDGANYIKNKMREIS